MANESSDRIPVPESVLFGRWVTAGLALVLTAAASCNDATSPDALAECLQAAGVTGEAVAIQNHAFHPSTLRVAPGTQVTWVNCERADAHTATADDGTWGSPMLSPGATFSRTFDQSGSFPYHCQPHPTMRGTVVVETGP
jgi:plastocyanin